MCLLKNVFILVEAMLFILGIAIVVTGIWILSDDRIGYYEIDEPFTPTSFMYKSSYILIVFGFVLMILGFVACFAIFVKSVAILCCMASIFMFPIVLILAALILAWCATENNYVKMALTKEMFSVWNRHDAFRKIESKLKCCGVFGPADYWNSSLLPISCIVRNTTNITTQNAYATAFKIMYQNMNKPANIESAYVIGCNERLQEVLRTMASVVCGLSTTIAILLGIALVLALIIRNKTKGGFIVSI